MALADKKVLMVMPPNRFNEDEFEITRKVLENRGVRVTIASTGLGELREQKRATARVTVKLDDVKTYDYDAIVFVGGEGARSEVADKIVTAQDAKYAEAFGNALLRTLEK